MDSGFQVLDSRFSVSEAWIQDSNCYWDSGFLELFSGFESPGFRIPQAKLPGFRILEAKISWIQDSGSKIYPDSSIWGDVLHDWHHDKVFQVFDCKLL